MFIRQFARDQLHQSGHQICTATKSVCQVRFMAIHLQIVEKLNNDRILDRFMVDDKLERNDIYIHIKVYSQILIIVYG